MFQLFKRRKRERKIPVVTEKAANAVRLALFKAKTFFAITMSRYEQRLTLSQKKIGLLLFCVAMGSLSTYWLYEGIYLKGKYRPGYLQQETITPLPNITIPDSLNIDVLQAQKHKWEAQKQLIDSNKNKR